MIAYFSGTGNSKYVASLLTNKLNDELLDINEYIKNNNTNQVKVNGRLVLVTPTYAWRIPRIISKWLLNTKFVGVKAIWYVMTCGDSIGNADKYNEKLSLKKGFKHMGTAKIIMPENYIALFDVPNDKEARNIIDKAMPSIDEFASFINVEKSFIKNNVNFNGIIESSIVNDAFYPLFVSSKAFWVKDTCVGCGKCVNACPLNNISLKEGKPNWESNCTHCMACICYCPKEAIEYGKKSNGKFRYHIERCLENQ